MTISYTPFDNTAFMQFDVDDVKQVYHGQLNSCRCGCTGEYFTSEDSEFLEVLQKAFNAFNNASAREVRGEIWDKERYLEICTKSFTSKDEDVEFGYALYLNK